MERKAIQDILLPGFEKFQTSSNRSNIVYATRMLVGGTSNIENYLPFVTYPFDPAKQPRTMIFRERSEECVRIAEMLDQSLPNEYQGQGLIMHYHSSILSI